MIRASAVRLVLRKEILETRRDRNLIVNLVLIPLFLYPVLGFGAYQVLQVIQGVSERETSTILVAGVPAAIVDSLDARPRTHVTTRLDTGETAEQIATATDFRRLRDERLAAQAPAPDALVLWRTRGESAVDSAFVFYDASRDRSRMARSAVVDDLRDWRRRASLETAASVGLSESEYDVFELVEEDTATATEKGQEVLSLVLPMILLMMLGMGTFYAALDTVVGERERGTLESILTSPLARGEILLGKFLYVTIASVTSFLLNLASLVLFLILVLRLIGSTAELRVQVEPAALLLILAAAILTAALFSALLMLLALPAKTYREGQAILTPFYFATFIPGIVVATSRAPFSVSQAFVPVLNTVALFKSALKGDLPAVPIVVTLAVLGACVAVVLALAARLTSREEIFLEPQFTLKELFLGGKKPS